MVLRNEAISFDRPRKTASDSGLLNRSTYALPVALFEVGQAVPLLGRGQQALGQERERLGEDGQLAGLGVAEPAVDADQIAQVEQFGAGSSPASPTCFWPMKTKR